PPAADSRDPSDVIEERGEIPARRRWIAIAIDVLPKQLDIAIAGAGQLQRLGNDRRAGAAALGAARERHYAISARLVTALDNRDVRPVGVVAAGHRCFEGVLGIQAQSRDAAV